MRWNAAILAGLITLPLTRDSSSRGGEAGGFAFAGDKAGRLLDKLLRPSEPASPRPGVASSQQASAVSTHIENPPAPVAPVQAELPKTKPEPPPKIQPRSPAEPLPLPAQDPRRPQMVGLPPGTRIRLESEDVNKPVPLPTLGQVQPDRAPLTDPTLEASVAAALAGRLPERKLPAPFVRLNLPEPFENTHAVRLRTPPAESTALPVALPRQPGP